MQISETNIQYVLQATLSGFSLICCLVVMIGFIAFKDLRKSALKLVLFLCISEMIYSISMIIRPPNQNNNSICATQIFFGNLGHLSTLFWSCMIINSLRCSVQYGYEHVRGVMNRVILTSCVVPAVLAGLQYYFTNNNFCNALQEGIEGTDAIQGEYTFFIQKLIILLEFQIPIYISFVFNLVSILKVAKLTKENQNHNTKLKLRRIYIYPFIIPVCQIFALIYQVYVLSGGDPKNQSLLTLNILFGSIQGAINSLVYGFNRKLRQSFKNVYNNRLSGVSTSLNESLVNSNQLNFSSNEQPQRKTTVNKHSVKNYLTSQDEEDYENSQNNSSYKRNQQNKVNINNTQHFQNKTLSDYYTDTNYSSQGQMSNPNKVKYPDDKLENESSHDNSEQSDDLLDDIFSYQSSPSKQFQLTIADF